MGDAGTSVWLPWMIEAIGAGASSALAPTPGQPRVPFPGVQGQYTHTQDLLDSIMSGMETRAAQPVSLPDAVVGDLPTFGGGGLPMPIGVLQQPSHGTLGTPPSLPGLSIPGVSAPRSPTGSGTGGSGGGSGSGTGGSDVGGGTSDTVGGGTGGGSHRVSMPVRQSFLPGDTMDGTGTGTDVGTGTGTMDFTSGMDSVNPHQAAHAAISLLRHVAGGGIG